MLLLNQLIFAYKKNQDISTNNNLLLNPNYYRHFSFLRPLNRLVITNVDLNSKLLDKKHVDFSLSILICEEFSFSFKCSQSTHSIIVLFGTNASVFCLVRCDNYSKTKETFLTTFMAIFPHNIFPCRNIILQNIP